MKNRLEERFDSVFTMRLSHGDALHTKKTRPPLHSHISMARLRGNVFRALMLAEFGEEGALSNIYAKPHDLEGVIGDPYMGAGTALLEANRLGFHTMGCEPDPVTCWIARQSLVSLDADALLADAAQVIEDMEKRLAPFYETRCGQCQRPAQSAYFLWVKRAACRHCGERNDLCSDTRVAYPGRYTQHIFACLCCGTLNEFHTAPSRQKPWPCRGCDKPMDGEGNVSRSQVQCRACLKLFPLPEFASPPKHRLIAIAVHCAHCAQEGRRLLLKAPGADDCARAEKAESIFLEQLLTLPLPTARIVRNSSTDTVFRWGYRFYSDLLNPRQALGLGLLLERILELPNKERCYALLTAFSGMLHFQNMLCRHDSRRLRCEGAPAASERSPSFISCENNVLGIEGATHGAFRQMVEKYLRAKSYGAFPFELLETALGKWRKVPVRGECVEAALVSRWPYAKKRRQALLIHGAAKQSLPPDALLDGVFTELPRCGLVRTLNQMSQAWLQKPLAQDFSAFRTSAPRDAASAEYQDQAFGGSDVQHFTESLSAVFSNFSQALRPRAPFVFAYAEEEAAAYLPIIVAMLDARLVCTKIFPALCGSREKGNSPVINIIFVCRPLAPGDVVSHETLVPVLHLAEDIESAFWANLSLVRQAEIRPAKAFRQSLLWALMAKWAVLSLGRGWSAMAPKPLAERIQKARRRMEQGLSSISLQALLEQDKPEPH